MIQMLKFCARVSVLLLITACLGCKPAPRQLTKVTLATSKNMWCSLSLIALDKGYFTQEGLDVDVKYLEAGRYCMDAVVSRSADLGNVVEVNVAFLGFADNQNVSVLGSIVSSTSSAIVGRKSKGVLTPEDLTGKKLALSPGTTSDVFAHRFIDRHGLKNVAVEKIQPLAMLGAMTSGGVDAASTWQPFVHNIVNQLGADAIIFKDSTIYVGYELVAVRRDWAAAHGDEIAAFVRAIKKAQDFVGSNVAESQQIISRVINLDLATVQATWSEYSAVFNSNTAAVKSSVTQIGQWISTTQEGFLGKAIPDYAPFFESSVAPANGK